MIEFEITKGELFCLAAMYGHGDLVNIPYEQDEFGEDLSAALHQITAGLRAKGWLEEDFDGNVTVPPHLELAAALCAAPERFWQVLVHGKQEAVFDIAAGIYAAGGCYLILNRLDAERYAGFLTEDGADVLGLMKAYAAFPEAAHTHTAIPASALSAVTEAEMFAAVNISRCALEVTETDKALLCGDVAMFLLLEHSGAYTLAAAEDESGVFWPLTREAYEARLAELFAGEEDSHEFA